MNRIRRVGVMVKDPSYRWAKHQHLGITYLRRLGYKDLEKDFATGDLVSNRSPTHDNRIPQQNHLDGGQDLA